MRNPSSGLLAALTCGALVACGSSSSPKQADAPPTANITISGTASSVDTGGRTPQAGVVVTTFKVDDDSMIATATTDAAGKFSITAPSNGAAIDGYLKATKAT